MRIPDDQVDPNEMLRRLSALAENFPKLLHEQVGAAKADSETAKADSAAALELTSELEAALSAESQGVKDAFASMRETIDALQLRHLRADVISIVQMGLLRVLITAVFDQGLDIPEDDPRRVGVVTAARLVAGIHEVRGWSDKTLDDSASLKDFGERMWPLQLPPPS